MKDLHVRLGGKVNVYTLDHRGTGRSTLFDCVAAQAMTSGSRGRDIKGTEVPSCAKDLRIKYGDLASFSITSAASDIASFISDYSNGASTFVYGESYGTALVERLMHLNPVTVKGYVLDGIAAPTGVSPDKFEYFSMWDADYGEVVEYFMSLCGLDSACKTRFQSANLSSALRNLMTKIDSDKNSTCASLVANEVTTVPPSFMFRSTLVS
ncbi:hypothetical protein ON010_g661 [Phytophthora cinnamomi]|nr:hypothetical protein ON010_g661 [Phytophthora cinnamomi]